MTTPLGADVLLLQRIVGTEAVSKPFEFTLDLLSLETSIDPKKLLRKSVTIEMDLPDGSVRYINGIVRRFVQLGRGATFTTYRAEVVPNLWLLSLSADCKVYQNKKVTDIVKAVFDEMGITDFKPSTSATYPAREYCVQYRETHLDFVSRLMEEEGIFYYFEHTKDKHTLVIADLPSAMKPGPVAKLPMNAADPGKAVPNSISQLEIGNVVTTGRVTLFDYNDEMPKRLESTVDGKPTGFSATSIRLFDYPGKFDAVAEADRVTKLHMEEREALTTEIRGHAWCHGLCSGYRLEVTGHYRRDINAQYQLISVHHDGVVSDYESGAGAPYKYDAFFVGIPQNTPYRPPRVTPRSVVHGSQTAVVVGPSGEEIYVDKHGRVKVQFFWDQLGKKDENSSCWVRVSNAWAGKGWGFIQIPRIGQEVIVDFLEGDPDRPIITGRVYNAEMVPPWALPANGTQSGLLTRSSKSGSASTFNELRFEDKKDSEEVYLHSQKDLNVVTENDETWMIKAGGRTTTIKKKNDTTTLEEGDQSLTIKKGKQTNTIEGDRETTINKGAEKLTVKTGDMTTEVSTGKHSLTVKTGDMITEVSTGNQKNTVKTGNQTTEVKLGNQETKVDVGNITVKAAAGKITIEAMQGIDLKVAGNTISITPSGITVKGIMVGIQGQATAEVKSPMTTVNGDGMLTLKGGITMIN